MARRREESGRSPGEQLHAYYEQLLRHLGPQRWWPARTRLEVILGAILTQNTAWQNAALGVRNLRRAGLLSLPRLQRASKADLESCIRPAGFFRQKAATIRNLLDHMTRVYRGSLAKMLAREPAQLRRQLLTIRGLGPETADAILLYAGRQAYFVADAYTRRVLERHGFLPAKVSYAKAQDLLHRHLPPDDEFFNEFHALLVEAGKRYCRRPEPRCKACPLRRFLASGLAAGRFAERIADEVRTPAVNASLPGGVQVEIPAV